MPLIKRRTRGKQFVRHIARLDRENIEALYAYTEFIGESSPDYVLNELIDTVLAKDKDFATWRAEHPQSFVPPSVLRARARPQTPRGPSGPTATSTPVDTGRAPRVS